MRAHERTNATIQINTPFSSRPASEVFEVGDTITRNRLISEWRRSQFLGAADLHIVAIESPDERDMVLADLMQGASRAATRASLFIPGEGVTKFSEPVQHLAQVIGKKTFAAIYTAPPPPELVDEILSFKQDDFLNESPLDSDLDQLTVEVLNGRLEWDDRFADAGARTPVAYMRAAEHDLVDRNHPVHGTY
jgi:hypothetical protein